MAKDTEKKTPRNQVEYQGETYESMASLALMHDLNPSAVRRGVRQGKTIDEAMAAAIRVKKDKAKKAAEATA